MFSPTSSAGPCRRALLAAALLAALGGSGAAVAADAAPATTRVLSREAVAARQADAASKFAELDGVRVHYKDEGQGPALLLVHGTFGDLGDWDGWTRALSGSYRIVRLDLPAFGLTGPVPSGNYSVDRMLSLVDALMDQLGVERFAIAGVSYGGLTAFRYAATRTERVTALILANSAGIQFGQRPATPQPENARPAAPGASAAATGVAPSRPPSYNITTDPEVTYADTEAFLKFLLNNAPVITPALVQRKLDYANIAGRLEESRTSVRLYERGNPERVLSHVRAPALVLWGGANQALSTQTADAFAKAMLRARSVHKVIYPDGGHIINLQRPEETARDVKAFLDREIGAEDRAAAAKRLP